MTEHIPIDYRELLLQFIASLTLCDHMGDVADDVNAVLNRLGIDLEAMRAAYTLGEDDETGDWWWDLRKYLNKMGITTLYGTSIGGDEEED